MKVLLILSGCFMALCCLGEAMPTSVAVADSEGVESELKGLIVREKRGDHHHEHATSYQNFNLQSYHPVPVYYKHDEHHGHGEELSVKYDSAGDLHGYGGEDTNSHTYASLGGESYHRSSPHEVGDEEGYAHLGAAASVSEGDESYGHHEASY